MAYEKHKDYYRLQKVIQDIIGNEISGLVISPNKKKLTCEYTDCQTDLRMKCTVEYLTIVSNIRKVQ